MAIDNIYIWNVFMKIVGFNFSFDGGLGGDIKV